MRKIAIIGGTGIYSPETLQCFEEKVMWDIKQLRIK